MKKKFKHNKKELINEFWFIGWNRRFPKLIKIERSKLPSARLNNRRPDSEDKQLLGLMDTTASVGHLDVKSQQKRHISRGKPSTQT